MNWTWRWALIPILAGSLSSSLYGATDWVVDILPGALHANFKGNGFVVTGDDGARDSISLVSSLPSIAAGFAVEQPEGYFDFKIGAGMLLNSRLSSFMFYGTTGLYLEVTPSIMMGPHIAISRFSAPEWWGDTKIEFSGTTGFSGGLHFVAGDRISYLLSIDYMTMDFDVRSLPEGTTASKRNLDMSGIAVQFGIRAQF